MYMSYNCQYSLFNLLCIFICIVNVDIPFGYSDILFMIINIYELQFVVYLNYYHIDGAVKKMCC